MSFNLLGSLTVVAFCVALAAMLRVSEAWRQVRALRDEVEALREYVARLHDYVTRSARAEVAREDRPEQAVAERAAPRVVPAPAPSETLPGAPGPSGAEASSPLRAAPVPEATGTGEGSVDDTAQLFRGAAASDAGLERRLGSRLPVWLGAIALALAGIFLVQYTIERGWLTPSRRVGLALAFGALLIAAGERVRGRAPRIAQALAAAGVADLYAALLAGVRLYGLIPPTLGFGLMAGTTALAVALALRHGPLPAILGLAGGFLTPALIGLESAGRSGSLVYLLLLDVGLLAAGRRRRWPGLAGGALGGTFLWVASSLLPGPVRFGTPALSIFLCASLALFAFSTLRPGAAADWGDEDSPQALALAAGLGGVVLMALVVGRSSFDSIEWGFFALLVAGSLVLATVAEQAYFALAIAAPAAAAAALLAWGAGLPAGELGRYLATSAGLGALVAGLSFRALLRSARPSRWATLTGLGAVVPMLLAARFGRAIGDLWLALAATLIAVLLSAATTEVARRRIPEAEADAGEIEEARTWLAASACGALAIALVLTFEREWLSIAFALVAVALIFLRERVPLRALPWLGGAFFAVAVVRLVVNPGVLHYPIGPNPVVSWLLWGYGLPCLIGFVAAARLRRERETAASVAVEAGAVAVAAAGVTLQAWQIAAPGRIVQALATGGLWAWSIQTTAWLALAVALLIAARRGERPARAFGGRILSLLGGAAALLSHGIVFNPAWSPQEVGATPILNWLLFYYGVPLALLFWIARELDGARERLSATISRAAATLLGFLLVTLEVRQLFRGSDLSVGRRSGAEDLSYSASWALLGTLLLLMGLYRGSRGLRLAALAAMLAATLKVFLYDASGLAGLYRVLSFLGLGAALLLLAWLYQRFVFHDESDA